MYVVYAHWKKLQFNFQVAKHGCIHISICVHSFGTTLICLFLYKLQNRVYTNFNFSDPPLRQHLLDYFDTSCKIGLYLDSNISTHS